jgi:hypothetical protein
LTLLTGFPRTYLIRILGGEENRKTQEKHKRKDQDGNAYATTDGDKAATLTRKAGMFVGHDIAEDEIRSDAVEFVHHFFTNCTVVSIFNYT